MRIKFKLLKMGLNTITIEFQACEPAPADGYKISYRPLGSEIEYRDGGNFMESPAVINDANDPAGTDYEGIIQGDCGGGFLGVPIPWTAINAGCEGSESEGSGSSSAPSSGSSGPSGFNAITVRYTELEGDQCTDPGMTAYLAAPATTLAPGVTVYATPDLGDPLVGNFFISEPSGPNYNIDPGTGVVGALTGNTC